MFGNDKNKPARSSGGGVETLIGPRVVIRGDVHYSGGLYVEGTIVGSADATTDGFAVDIDDGSGPLRVVVGETAGGAVLVAHSDRAVRRASDHRANPAR